MSEAQKGATGGCYMHACMYCMYANRSKKRVLGWSGRKVRVQRGGK
jgi:hypothetical protein